MDSNKQIHLPNGPHARRTKACEACGTVFTAHSIQRFCSRTCAARARWKKAGAIFPSEEAPEGHKWCTACQVFKPFDSFTSNIGRADGFANQCRACVSVKMKEKYQRDPKYKQRAQNRARRRYHSDIETERERRRIYREAHPEQKRTSDKAYAQRRRTWFYQFKSAFSCTNCGESHPACLDFHHREPKQKLFNIGEILMGSPWTEDEIQQEVAKCTVYCSNCHRKMHWEEKHGVGKPQQISLPL